MSPQVGPWEQAERGPVSIRNTGRHNGLCLQLHCWQTPTQRSWKGSPSVLTHTEEWVSVLLLRAVFVQYIQLLFMVTVLPSMGAEVLMKTRRKGLLCGCRREFMFIRWPLCLLDGTCMYAEKPQVMGHTGTLRDASYHYCLSLKLIIKWFLETMKSNIAAMWQSHYRCSIYSMYSFQHRWF